MRLFGEVAGAVGRAREALQKPTARDERAAVTASSWVARSGATDVIAHTLVQRLSERTVDNRIEAGFLAELGQTRAEVLRYIFIEVQPREARATHPSVYAEVESLDRLAPDRANRHPFCLPRRRTSSTDFATVCGPLWVPSAPHSAIEYSRVMERGSRRD